MVLRGGRIIDPASGTDAVGDVVVDDGRIVAVGPGAADAFPEAEAIDAAGLVVTPGLIDMHVHVMPGLGDFCVAADTVGVGMGVPVVVDGGTSGVATFDLARAAVIDHPATATRVLAFLDPNQLYLATKDFICHRLELANDERNLDVDALAASLERNADVVVGLKVRACSTTDPEHSPFLAAAQAAAPERPVMVHLGRFPHTPTIPTRVLLGALRPGDIITHAFRGAGGFLQPEGVVPEFVDAIDRGVRLDVGHSGTDFRFREARRLFDAGYLPDTISTDLNVFTIDGPVYSLAETMTKVWALGVELADVVAMATTGPATSLRRPHELGALAPGRVADVSVLAVEEGEFTVTDGFEVLAVERRLVPVGCLRAGAWHAADRVRVAA